MLTTTTPPPVLATRPPTVQVAYTSHYCEENVYLLLQTLASDASVADTWNAYAVFISNETKSVALWNQKLAPEDSVMPVVWDYHVVALLRPKEPEISQECEERVLPQAWIYDFDSRIPTPVLLEEYLEGTFRDEVPTQFQSLFRVVSAQELFDYFASDRSHMLSSEASLVYVKPPPGHAAIRGTKAVHDTNLMGSFVNMRNEEDTYGRVVSLEELQGWC
ncbi:N-terminal glutamine amidase-domain-containing protein [Schizophyllum amplum]|uniref:Protein N-terminal glutamine amidohydrolase n=1 Tax=Schizophyllum amplum TaxID=97359 RepID=A0A550CAI7_9AGAR|nr:N-terminal glutamine amidase-domain-containing protein [Auriculariopsis ampla]